MQMSLHSILSNKQFSSVFVIIIIISCVLTFFRILLVFYLPVINDFFMEI